MKPTVSVPAPSTAVRNTGSSPWIISDEISMNRLTKPSAQMLPGSRVSDDVILFAGDCSLMTSDLTPSPQRHASDLAQRFMLNGRPGRTLRETIDERRRRQVGEAAVPRGADP